MDATFESAVDAVISGNLASLAKLLREDPSLIQARSQRSHHATLLHYVAANGVEDERQVSPANASEVARFLLSNGAEVDALADMYNARQTTMDMLVSSAHPAKAGVQNALVETLLDFGAAIEGVNNNSSPLLTALAHGYTGAAQTLVRRGARTNTLAVAAGLGLLPQFAQLLPSSNSEERLQALALAAQHGHADIVRLLLDAGEDPNRYNPPGFHSHSTPLHQAVWNGREEVVRLLINRQARTDIKDTYFHGTPLDWARHAGRTELENVLTA